MDWNPIKTGTIREIFVRFVIAYCLAKNVVFDQIINETYNNLVKQQRDMSNWLHFGVRLKGKNGSVTARGHIFNGLETYNGSERSFFNYLDTTKITG